MIRQSEPCVPSPLSRRLLGLGAAVLVAGAVLLLGAAPAAAAVPISREALQQVEEGAPVQLAAGKNFRQPSAKPPQRGTSAELHGGSSADRYGGSSADRNGVAGRRDIRNRGVHARRERPKADRQRAAVEQPEDEEAGEGGEQSYEDRQGNLYSGFGSGGRGRNR